MKMKKKILAAVLAVIASAAILSGCSKSEETDEAVTTTVMEPSADTSDVTSDETEETTAAKTEATESETSVTETASLTDEQKANIEAFFGSVAFEYDTAIAENVESFSAMAEKDADKTVPYAESQTKALVDSLYSSDSYSITLKNDNTFTVTAAKGDKLKIAVCTGDIAAAMIFGGNEVYSYSPMDMNGYKITLNDEDMEDYTKEGLLETAILTPNDENSEVKVFDIEANGKKYTYELFDSFAYIFDEDGAAKALCDGTDLFYMEVLTEDVPDDTFAQLEGYDIMDYDELLKLMEDATEQTETSGEETAAEETTAAEE